MGLSHLATDAPAFSRTGARFARECFRDFWSAVTVAALTFPMIAAMGPASAQTSTQAAIKVGVIGAISDAGFYIADKKGYFKDEGLSVEIVDFRDSAQMVALLGTGQLDVGAGAPSASLYNSVARGIDIRAVADKGSMPKDYGYTVLVVRKELVDDGRYKSIKDLRDLKLGSQTPGGAATALLDRGLKKAGLTFKDMEIAYMGHPQLALAIDSAAIDAAFITEPNATNAVRLGRSVKVMRGDEVYPDQQLAVVLYAGRFAKQTATARKFMVAYLRGVRLYNDALSHGRMAGPRANEVISILAASADVHVPEVYREIVPAGCNPDGKMNVASMQADLDMLRDQGLVTEDVKASQLVDASFAEAAVAHLGSYKRAMH
ncbi:ABC transporter substrate-binding protein [Roseiarcaceae bacterium H3SJ34-1]|uniref:ABC transporter substrate-binding protein n=1 Tax=Terripilifer ovatus TaxID=3032367 RepID=UPI003AB94724|nr:ABC transporter substrate-binding protein [Roseiarcaceae bacterium H3SJ34-1]